jgi:hypothetical protein
MADKGKLDLGDKALGRNARQRVAIMAYIELKTGRGFEDVPESERRRLALEWVRLYGASFE